MLKSLPAIAGLAALLAVAAPASAHPSDEDHFHVWRPYVIVKDCDDDFRHCKARMEYAPGQHAGRAGAGSYWYRLPGQSFRHDHDWDSHAQWCAARYRSYNASTDSYMGYDGRRHRCTGP